MATLSVAASRVVGRKATGDIDDMTAAETLAVLGLTGLTQTIATGLAAAPITGVTVDAAAIHAALVTLGLITT